MEENIQEFTITCQNRGAIGFTNNTEELVIPEFFVGDGTHATVKGLTYQITEIGLGAFGDCRNLQKVVLPDSIVKIQAYAFANDSRLEEISLSKELQTIGQQSFFGTKLQKIHLPENLVRISYCAFSHCKYLEAVDTISAKKLKEICSGAFSNCSQLKTFELPKKVVYFASSTFCNTPLCRLSSKSHAYKSIHSGQLLIDSNKHRLIWASSQNRDLVIPHGISEIDSDVFLEKKVVFIPKTVQQISDSSLTDLANGTTLIINKKKESIPYVPVNGKNIHIYWIG